MVDSQEPEQYVLGLNYPVRADWFDGGGGGAGVSDPTGIFVLPWRAGAVECTHYPTGIRQQSERRRSPAVGEDGPVLVDCSDSRCSAL